VVVRRRKKVTKQRGKRTYGRGCAKRGRGSGEKGGRGASGRHKHLWSYVIKYEPDYFGKRGFRRPVGAETRGINVGEIDERLEELLGKGLAQRADEVYVVDLAKLGFSKLLGGGSVRHKLEIRAAKFSESARRKVEEAGGRILGGEDGGTPTGEV
jgi:large subunit ribosomal protein L15